jgi:hypothetical protein
MTHKQKVNLLWGEMFQDISDLLRKHGVESDFHSHQKVLKVSPREMLTPLQTISELGLNRYTDTSGNECDYRMLGIETMAEIVDYLLRRYP